jgi:pimeloyl-ACP methyl ester carboxylesterase
VRTLLPLGIAATLLSTPVAAEPCREPVTEQAVRGNEECLVSRTYRGAGPIASPALAVIIHGDVSGGGPASYHFAFAERLAGTADNPNVVVVALVRPGYDDGEGNVSTGTHYQRTDSYTPYNIDEAAMAIRRLKDHHRASRVVLIAHSGGTAYAGVIIGRHPALADEAVLVSCPCDIARWREGVRRGRYTRSLSPSDWVAKVPETTRVTAFTGERDTNTFPVLAEDYVASLVRRGVPARFEVIPAADHNGAFRSEQVMRAALASLGAP